MKRAWFLLILAGCGGASPLTLVDELRVLGLAVEPASPAPGEVPQIDVLVADPGEQGFQTHTWACVGEVCAICEDGACAGIDAGERLDVWALVCAPGACDGPGPDLADPDAWMAELPLVGVSLARRSAPISPSATERINANPQIAPDGTLPAEVQAGATIPLPFLFTDDPALPVEGLPGPRVYGFATAGGFQQDAGPVVEGRAELMFVAPDTAGSVELFAVADDGLGGASWWSGRIEVIGSAEPSM